MTFTAATTFGGNAPKYQWQLNGNNTGTNADTYTDSSLTSGDVVNCIFTSSLPCNTPIISNSITVTVNRKVTTTVNENICDGENYAGHTTSGIYTDVFTGSNGCDSTRTLNLVVYPNPTSVLDTAICFGTSYQGYSATGAYNTVYKSVNGCDSTHTLNLTILPDINSVPYMDTILCTGDAIILSPGIFDSYLWQDGSAKNNFVVTRGGTYFVRVSDKCGIATRTTVINERVCNIMFPNAFTPNRDGVNDVFNVLNAYNLSQYRVIIFDRWGQKVFQSNGLQKGWDGLIKGLPAPVGIYAWICDYKKAGATGIEHLKGTVTLLR